MAKPPAEIQLSSAQVGAMIREQHPGYGRLPLTEATAGWDNVIFRLGSDLAVRLPRRAAAAGQLENEQRWLPVLQPGLPLPIPAPLAVGRPQGHYPWKWSITPWFAGETLDQVPLAADQIEVLASFLEALHRPAPADAPFNPWRSPPLPQRQSSFDRCVAELVGTEYEVDDGVRQLWVRAVSAPPDLTPTWIHADLHPRNVLATNGRISAVIDWGDLARGDPAVDLAATWMLLPEAAHRERLMSLCAGVTRYTWDRARGGALLYALSVLRAADPEHLEAGLATLRHLREGP